MRRPAEVFGKKVRMPSKEAINEGIARCKTFGCRLDRSHRRLVHCFISERLSETIFQVLANAALHTARRSTRRGREASRNTFIRPLPVCAVSRVYYVLNVCERVACTNFGIRLACDDCIKVETRYS